MCYRVWKYCQFWGMNHMLRPECVNRSHVAYTYPKIGMKKRIELMTVKRRVIQRAASILLVCMWACKHQRGLLNTLNWGQNGCHFEDNIFICILLYENVWILIKISLKFDFKGPINNIPALFQIMAWLRSGNKPYLNQLEWAASNGNRYPPYPQVMATAISQ